MKLTLPRPFEAQKKFLEAKARYIAYGGSRGGGKSCAVRMKAILLSLYYPHIRILILRRTYPEVYENHIKELAIKTAELAVYRDSDKSLTFKNGSRIKFGYCATDSDLTQYQGVEYDVIFMDEAT
ncbi:MAG: phage terminase large subunit [Clostridia bacterium]|nr:phage terminase large subunit [Clostridia bacterium]